MSSPHDSRPKPKTTSQLRKVRWEGHLSSIVEETQSKGETAVIEKKSYIIYVSPIHNANNETPYPHQRIMIYSKNAAITKEQALSAISKICRISLTDIINISFLQIDSKGWICRAWNPSILSKSEPEQMIKDCINLLESEKLIVTSKNLKARLRKYHGTHFMNRP